MYIIWLMLYAIVAYNLVNANSIWSCRI